MKLSSSAPLLGTTYIILSYSDFLLDKPKIFWYQFFYFKSLTFDIWQWVLISSCLLINQTLLSDPCDISYPIYAYVLMFPLSILDSLLSDPFDI